MEDARLLARLEQIDALTAAQEPAPVLLAELRALLGEAEAWSRRHDAHDALAAVGRCREALERLERFRPAETAEAPTTRC